MTVMESKRDPSGRARPRPPANLRSFFENSAVRPISPTRAGPNRPLKRRPLASTVMHSASGEREVVPSDFLTSPDSGMALPPCCLSLRMPKAGLARDSEDAALSPGPQSNAEAQRTQREVARSHACSN